MLARVLFLAVAVAITIGVYHYLPGLLFGGSSEPAPKPAMQAAKPVGADDPVTYVDINMKDRPNTPVTPSSPAAAPPAP